MSRRPRRNHSPDFKAKVAFAAIKGDHTLAELSAQLDIHANQILDWKNPVLNQSARVFESATSKPEPDVDLKAHPRFLTPIRVASLLVTVLLTFSSSTVFRSVWMVVVVGWTT